MNEGYLEHAGVKGMKWGVRKSKVSLSSSTKNTSKRELNETEKNRLLVGGLGSLVATPVFGAGVYGATKYANRKNTKQAVADILGSDISKYSKSSLKRAGKTLNKYGNVEIKTKKGTVSLNYDGVKTTKKPGVIRESVSSLKRESDWAKKSRKEIV